MRPIRFKYTILFIFNDLIFNFFVKFLNIQGVQLYFIFHSEITLQSRTIGKMPSFNYLILWQFYPC